jgi:hypothetical protein
MSQMILMLMLLPALKEDFRMKSLSLNSFIHLVSVTRNKKITTALSLGIDIVCEVKESYAS